MDISLLSADSISALSLRLIGLSFVVAVLFTSTGCGGDETATLAIVNDDTVTLTNTSGQENGILVDGQLGSNPLEKETFVFSTASTIVGQVTSSMTTNEVVAFTNRRPVAINTAPGWTPGHDNVPVPFNNEIQIAVTVWIVKGPYDAQEMRAIRACAKTSGIWTTERMGVVFSDFDIEDATNNPNAEDFYHFDGDACRERSGPNGIETLIGKTKGRINVYYVDTVDKSTGTKMGRVCKDPFDDTDPQGQGSDIVVLGSGSERDLLAHELGHAFSLEHLSFLSTSQRAFFDDTSNIMLHWSTTRQFITEGQLFRSHLNFLSALNFVYGKGQPTKDCEIGEDNDECPGDWKRIWADGACSSNDITCRPN